MDNMDETMEGMSVQLDRENESETWTSFITAAWLGFWTKKKLKGDNTEEEIKYRLNVNRLLPYEYLWT